MKTYEVECCGHIHRIGLDKDGELYLLDHDIEEEEALAEMGIETSECFGIVRDLQELPATDTLIQAIANEDLLLMELAFALGAKPQGEDVLMGDYYSHGEPLSEAVQTGNFDIVKRLFDAGLEADYDYDSLVLMYAAKEGRADIVRLLLNNGAATDWISRRGYESIGRTGYGDVIDVFIDAGVDPGYFDC